MPTYSEILKNWQAQSQFENNREEALQFADTSPAERLYILADLCRMGSELLAQNPRADVILRSKDPLTAEAAALWQRLMRSPRETL